LIEAQAESDHTGQGAINREEKIELRVAAVIVDRLPNGNFVIAGRQQVLINSEMRELTVSGMIRPQDISAENTIRHDQIAEARVSYGGRGQVSAVQRPNYGQRLGDAVTPY
jgi:flagellar L-ring protein precursor FlgH